MRERGLAEDERPLILMPTYNERDNLPDAVGQVFEHAPDHHLLVIDDASPDGTGELADEMARVDRRIRVLHRAGKQGLGKAYIDGFRWALEHPAGYTHIYEMDADLSHDPRYLMPLLQACRDGADLALGSRYVPGGGITGWGPHRLVLSRGGSLYARTILGVDVSDLTGGFKCFTRAALASLPLTGIQTVGYGFQIEVTYRVLRAGFKVTEVPIVFPDRVKGRSKMSLRIVMEGVTSVWKLRREGR